MHINMHSEHGVPVLDVEGPISVSEVGTLRCSITEWFADAGDIIVDMHDLSASEYALVRLLVGARMKSGRGNARCRWHDPSMRARAERTAAIAQRLEG